MALLDRPAALEPVLLQLGVRHAGYGVQPAHYDTVGAALLDTLQTGLGAAFTPSCAGLDGDVHPRCHHTMQRGAAAGTAGFAELWATLPAAA